MSTLTYVGSATSTHCFLRKMWCQEKTFKLQFKSVKTPFVRIVIVIWILGPAGSSSKFCHCLSKNKLGNGTFLCTRCCHPVQVLIWLTYARVWIYKKTFNFQSINDVGSMLWYESPRKEQPFKIPFRVYFQPFEWRPLQYECIV